MVVDNLFSVIHATVADLDGIAVEDFSEFVLFREVFVRSNLIIVEHSTIIRNGKTQHWILHKEYSSPIAERLLAAPN